MAPSKELRGGGQKLQAETAPSRWRAHVCCSPPCWSSPPLYAAADVVVLMEARPAPDAARHEDVRIGRKALGSSRLPTPSVVASLLRRERGRPVARALPSSAIGCRGGGSPSIGRSSQRDRQQQLPSLSPSCPQRVAAASFRHVILLALTCAVDGPLANTSLEFSRAADRSPRGSHTARTFGCN